MHYILKHRKNVSLRVPGGLRLWLSFLTAFRNQYHKYLPPLALEFSTALQEKFIPRLVSCFLTLQDTVSKSPENFQFVVPCFDTIILYLLYTACVTMQDATLGKMQLICLFKWTGNFFQITLKMWYPVASTILGLEQFHRAHIKETCKAFEFEYNFQAAYRGWF